MTATGTVAAPIWHRICLAALGPMALQFYLLYLVFEWAERDSGAAAFYPLAAIFVAMLAVPCALIANVWMIQETRTWKLLWVMLIGVAQAVLVPVLIVAAFLLA